MSNEWKTDYKGYGIVPSSSWSTDRPFTAGFAITKPTRGGQAGTTHEVIHQGFVEGTFHSEQAAWDAAMTAARAYIDDLPPLT